MGQPVRKGYSVDAQDGSNIAGRYSRGARCLANNAVAAEPKKEETITLPRVVVQDQTNPYVPPQSSLMKFPEPVKDTLQSITIVAQRLIEEHTGSVLRDALRNVTGIGIAAREGGAAQVIVLSCAVI